MTSRQALLKLSMLLICGVSLFACDDRNPAPDAGTFDASLDAGPEDGGVPCTSDEMCSDGLFCTGEETCVSGRCQAAPPPDCSDGIECTIDRCDPVAQACRSSAPDVDGDGFGDASCVDGDGSPLGTDCDDNNSHRFVGNLELCDADNIDEDCDPATFGEVDADGDGVFAARCCNGTNCGMDCDDTRAGVKPGNTEVCNGLDDDCDGMVDEEVSIPGFIDSDFDGRGDDARPANFCPGTLGFSALSGDCDDDDPTVYEGAAELCDTKDNDCDGTVDESAIEVNWFEDRDGDGFGSSASSTRRSCAPLAGYTLTDLDCDDDNAAVNPASAELCNGIDDNCDGEANFMIGVNDFEDDDGDGLVDIACAPIGTDCDDADPRTGDSRTAEICDGRDNDCDGRVDEGATTAVWYRDGDGDGWGSERSGAMVACMAGAGFVARGGDCDDTNAAISPDATETCNGLDDNCNSAVDDGAAQLECAADHASAFCAFGSCILNECDEGFEDCDGAVSNGCERDVNDDASCGCRREDCTDRTRYGPAGTCERDGPGQPYTCRFQCVPDVWDDCDHNPSNGCETNIETDIFHCGGCGAAPACTHPESSCVGGVCTATACGPDRMDCNGISSDGCEAEVRFDPAHCGDCRTVCGDMSRCEERSCVCEFDYGDCNGDPSDGCETRTLDNNAHCGGCMIACTGGDVCRGTRCEPPMSGPSCSLGMPCPTGFCGGGGTCQNVVDVATGGEFTCVVLSDNSVWCWGRGAEGQLGDDTLSDSTIPVRVMGLSAQHITAGARHACAIDMSNRAVCWGLNADGQVGTPRGDACSPSEHCRRPAFVSLPDVDVLDLVAGDTHTCATISNAGTDQVWCWGRRDVGQLGDGGTASPTSRDAPMPVVITGTGVETLTPGRLALGNGFTCGEWLPDTIACFGDNTHGQINQDSTATSAYRTPAIAMLMPSARAVWAGGDRACALHGPIAGLLACWGRNVAGELGVATAGDYPSPQDISGYGSTTDMALGSDASCLLTSFDGPVFCFGSDVHGALGDGAVGGPSTSTPTVVPTLSNAMALSHGPSAGHVCAITTAGDLFCWGANGRSQVGNARTEDVPVPFRVMGL